MPRGGKKKKKGRTKTRARDVRQVNTGRSSAAASASSSSAQGSPKQVPTPGVFPNFDPSQQRGKALPDSFRTEYSRYKAATKRVFDYLQDFARKAKKNDHLAQEEDEQTVILTVNSLITAVDWMAEAKILVDPDVLKDLKFSIRVRSKVARSFYGGGDAGHQYLLDTLVYCWKVLDSLPRVEKKKNTREKEEGGMDGWSRNPYEALQDTGEFEGDDNGLVDVDIFCSQDIRRPTLNSDESIPLQDILDSEDRTDACLFLFALDNLMRGVVQKFRKVAEVVDLNVKAGVVGDSFGIGMVIPSVLLATITTNMAIQQVQRLEIEFELQNPHLNTTYRLLSTVLLPIQVQRVVQITREHGQKVCSVRDANLFVGDCLECSFRKHGDPNDKKSGVLSNFCSRFQINKTKGSEAIDDIYQTIRFLTVGEVPLGHEFEMTKDLDRPLDYAWLHPKNFEYIGGDRAIHHTIRLLQYFSYFAKAIPEGMPMPVKPLEGHFGPSPWQPGRSNKIRYDLDELLMNEILPDWLFLCREWILKDATTFSRQSELAPLWSCFRRFVRSPDKPLKWSTVFAVHAILTATLETDKVTNEVAFACQTTFESYFRQLDIACEHKKGVNGSFDSSTFLPGMTLLQHFKQLADPLFGPRALWNPLCAGTSLLYLNYQRNIDYGTLLIDDRAQLKIVLHLYHALVINDILQREDIPFLDGLYNGFKKSKTMWGGSLPRKGLLVEQFWLSIGGIFMFCGKKVAEAYGTMTSNQDHLAMIKILWSSEAEVMSGQIPPKEFSTSFRRICNRDYHDVVDKYHPKEMRREERDDYVFAVQVNDTADAFMDEHQLFTYNLPACGIYLDEFVCGMSRFFQWDKLFKDALRDQNVQFQDPERMAEIYMFARCVLETLDQSKHTNTSELERIRKLVTCFMRPFFEKLSKEKERIYWFEYYL